MARLLVRLKATLLLRGAGRSTAALLGTMGGILFGGMVALGVFLALTGGGSVIGVDAWAERLVLVGAAVWIGWIVTPMITFSADDTLDPRRFALLPLTARQLVPGLLLASFVGIAPVLTAGAVSGAAIGAGRAAGSVVAAATALLAIAALLLACVAWARAAATALSTVLGGRRARELAALVGGAAAVGLYLLVVVVLPSSDLMQEIDLSGPAAALRWTPGGLAGDAIGAAAQGQLGGSLVRTASVLASALLGVVVWVVALARTDRRTGTTKARRAKATGLYPATLRWLPRGRTTAVAVRFLRGLARDARVRSQALGQLVLLVPAVAISAGSGALDSERAPLVAAFVAVPIALIGTNALALDGPALWQHELAGEAPRSDLLGRTLGLGLLTVPPTILAAAGLAAAVGTPAYVPGALVLAAAAFLTASGTAVVAAVWFPIPVPERDGSNLFGQANVSGQGCVNSIALVGVMVALTVLSIPLLLAATLPAGATGQLAASGAALVYGAGVLWAGLILAIGRMRGRGPELLAAIDPERG